MPKIKERRVIGLTGGIASGKSTVLRELKRLGFRTLDSDLLAREAVKPGRPALAKIRRAFGKGVFAGKGLDRAALADIVFKNPRARKKLESIIHPEVVRRIKAEIRRHRKGILIVDIPLLFEAKLEKLADQNVVVWVPENLQLRRLMKRNGLDRPEALLRIRSQMPLAKKRKKADVVIDNSKSLARTRDQIRRWFES